MFYSYYLQESKSGKHCSTGHNVHMYPYIQRIYKVVDIYIHLNPGPIKFFPVKNVRRVFEIIRIRCFALNLAYGFMQSAIICRRRLLNKRDLKHRRRRAKRTTTGSKISPYCATAHARLVVHMKFRTSERQVCRPERT